MALVVAVLAIVESYSDRVMVVQQHGDGRSETNYISRRVLAHAEENFLRGAGSPTSVPNLTQERQPVDSGVLIITVTNSQWFVAGKQLKSTELLNAMREFHVTHTNAQVEIQSDDSLSLTELQNFMKLAEQANVSSVTIKALR